MTNRTDQPWDEDPVAPEVGALHVVSYLRTGETDEHDRPIRDAPMWAVEVDFDENDRRTRADAFLTVGRTRLHGWGLARRNPADPDVPRIGEEVAAARALADLASQLAAAASADMAAHGAPS